MRKSPLRIALLFVLVLLIAVGVALYLWLPRPEQLVLTPDVIELRDEAEREPRTPLSDQRTPLLLIGIDGVDRDLLYRELEGGHLPGLARLLGRREEPGDTRREQFPHAWFYPTLLAELPTSTIANWVSLFTGVPPGEHGAPGNEFFIREEARFAAPVPTAFDDPRPLLGTYTDDYVNDLTGVPTFYEQLRDDEPGIRIWVALSQVFRGADRLMIARHGVIGDAFAAFFTEGLADAELFRVVGALDEEVVRNTAAELEEGELPDILTVYLFGTDLFAHRADEGPTPARTQYLRDVLDPAFQRLYDVLTERDAMADRYVVVVSDHGHTEVRATSERALGSDLEADPPAVLRRSGFRVRPGQYDTEDDFQSVLAYQGGMAFVYIADRTTCPDEGDACDWTQPPRYEQDLLDAAEAFHNANREGRYARKLQGSLDLILVRDPGIDPDEALPFVVYLGAGRTQMLETYLEASPRPMYPALIPRLRDLTTGAYADRAGDILLIPHNGTRENPADRFYFSPPDYASWHGNPSHWDSDIPLIIAHPRCTAEELRQVAEGVLGEQPRLHRVTGLLKRLRTEAVCGG